MRVGGYLLAISVSLAVSGAAQAQRILGPMPSAAPTTSSTPPAPVSTESAAPAAPAPAVATESTCKNPNAIGISRVVEIDTAGGPGFGSQHFKAYDFLQPKEVVLTFDDGPWVTTPILIDALDKECVKALFFPIGLHATYYPQMLKRHDQRGDTIGSHTWSHKDLSKLTPDQAKEEIEKGASAVGLALGHPPAPFFRFPDLRQPPEMISYLGTRNIGIFSTDIDSFDFKMRKPEQVVKSVMAKLKKDGKGIVLIHENHPWSANAVAPLLAELKAGGYKIVHIKAKDPQMQTIPEFDDAVRKELGPANVSQRPMSSVVRTVQ